MTLLHHRPRDGDLGLSRRTGAPEASGAPRPRACARWAILLAVCLVGAAQPERDPLAAIRWWYVPAGQVSTVLPAGTGLVNESRSEFESLLRAARRGMAAARDTPAAAIVQVRVTARLRGPVLAGTAEILIKVRSSGPAVVPLEPWSLPVEHAAWPDGPALLGSDAAGRTVVVAPGPGSRRLTIHWAARARTAPDGLAWAVGLTRAPVRSLSLTLPNDQVPLCPTAVIEKLDGPAANPPGRGLDPPGWTRWRLALAGPAPVTVTIRGGAAATVRPLVLAQCHSQYQLAASGITVSTTVTLDVRHHGVDRLRFRLDPGLEPRQVEGIDLASWNVEADAGGPILVLHPVRPLLGRATLDLRLWSALPLGTEADLPRLQPLGWAPAYDLLTQGIQLTVVVAPELALLDLEPRDAVRTRVPDGQDTSNRIRLVGLGGQATARVRVGYLQPRVESQVRTWLAVSSGPTRAVFRVTWKVQAGKLLSLQAGLPSGWSIIDVGLDPDDLMRSWDVGGGTADHRLEIHLTRSLSAGSKPVTATIRAVESPRPRGGGGGPAVGSSSAGGLGEERSVPLPGIRPAADNQPAMVTLGLLAISVEPPDTVDVRKSPALEPIDVAQLGLRWWPQPDPKLAFRFESASLLGTLRVSTQRLRAKSDVWVAAVLADNRLDLGYRLQIQPLGRPISRVGLKIGPGPPPPESWRVVSPPGVQVRRITESPRSTACPGSWVLGLWSSRQGPRTKDPGHYRPGRLVIELTRPVSQTLVLEAQDRQDLAQPHAVEIPLPSIETRGPQAGLLLVRSAAAFDVEPLTGPVHPRLIADLPAEMVSWSGGTTDETGEPGARPRPPAFLTLAYDYPPGATAVQFKLRRLSSVGVPNGMAVGAVLTSRIDRAGLQHHQLRYSIVAHRDFNLRIEMPAGGRLREVRAGPMVLPVGGPASVVKVPIRAPGAGPDQGGRAQELVLDYDVAGPALRPLVRLDTPLPKLSIPVVGILWRVELPPGYENLSVEPFARLQATDELRGWWTRRLFSPVRASILRTIGGARPVNGSGLEAARFEFARIGSPPSQFHSAWVDAWSGLRLAWLTALAIWAVSLAWPARLRPVRPWFLLILGGSGFVLVWWVPDPLAPLPAAIAWASLTAIGVGILHRIAFPRPLLNPPPRAAGAALGLALAIGVAAPRLIAQSPPPAQPHPAPRATQGRKPRAPHRRPKRSEPILIPYEPGHVDLHRLDRLGRVLVPLDLDWTVRRLAARADGAAAAGVVITAARYRIEASEDRGSIRAAWTVQRLGDDGPCAVAIPLEGASLRSLTLDGRPCDPVALPHGRAGFALPIPGAGPHQLVAELEAVTGRHGSVTDLAVHIPPVARSEAVLQLPGAAWTGQITSAAGPQSPGTAAGGVRWAAQLGPVDLLSARWSPRSDEPAPAAVAVDPLMLVDVAADWTGIEAVLRYHLGAAARDRFEISLSPAVHVLGVEAPGLRSFALEPQRSGQRLTIDLQSPAQGTLALRLRMAAPGAAGGKLSLPRIVPERAAARPWTIGVRGADYLGLSFPAAWTEVSPAGWAAAWPEFPDLAATPVRAAFQAGGGAAEMALTAAPIGAHAELSQTLRIEVLPTRLDLVLHAVLDSREAPVFELRLRVPRRLQIDQVQMTGMTQWLRPRPDRVVLRSNFPITAARPVLLHGWIPEPAPQPGGAGSSRTWTLPRLVPDGAGLGNATILVYRAPGLGVEPENLEALDPIDPRAARLPSMAEPTAKGPVPQLVSRASSLLGFAGPMAASPAAGAARRASLGPPLAFRVRGADYGGSLRVTASPRRVRADMATQVVVGDEDLNVKSVIDFDSTPPAPDRVRIQVPAGLSADLKVNGQAVAEAAADQFGPDRVWTERRPEGLEGPFRVVVTGTMPIPPDGVVELPQLKLPDAVVGADFIAISNNGSLEWTEQPEGAIGRLGDAGILSRWFSPLDGAPGTAYRVGPGPWRLSLRIQDRPANRRKDPVVALCDETTSCNAAGEETGWTVYTARARHACFLSVRLPDRARLLAVTRDGLPVEAVQRGGAEGSIQVPLIAAGRDQRVGLSWRRPPMGRGRFGLAHWITVRGVGGRADPGGLRLWSVKPPPDVLVLRAQGGGTRVSRARLEIERLSVLWQDLAPWIHPRIPGSGEPGAEDRMVVALRCWIDQVERVERALERDRAEPEPAAPPAVAREIEARLSNLRQRLRDRLHEAGLGGVLHQVARSAAAEPAGSWPGSPVLPGPGLMTDAASLFFVAAPGNHRGEDQLRLLVIDGPWVRAALSIPPLVLLVVAVVVGLGLARHPMRRRIGRYGTAVGLVIGTAWSAWIGPGGLAWAVATALVAAVWIIRIRRARRHAQKPVL